MYATRRNTLACLFCYIDATICIKMAEMQQYTVNDLYEGPMVHDIVAKLRNCMLGEKGMNPSITADIKYLDVVDFTKHLKSIGEENDEVCIAMRDMCNVLTVYFYDLLGFQKGGRVWDPNTMGPYNDITKVYVAAVQHHTEKYHCSSNTTNLSSTNPPATSQIARQNTVTHANWVPKKNMILPLSQLDTMQDEDKDYVDESSDAELSSDGSFAGKIEEDNDILSSISLDGKECTYKEMCI